MISVFFSTRSENFKSFGGLAKKFFLTCESLAMSHGRLDQDLSVLETWFFSVIFIVDFKFNYFFSLEWLNKIHWNLKRRHRLGIYHISYMIFTQDDWNILFYIRFNPFNSRFWKNVSRTLNFPDGASLIFRAFYFNFINIIEIKKN